MFVAIPRASWMNLFHRSSEASYEICECMPLLGFFLLRLARIICFCCLLPEHPMIYQFNVIECFLREGTTLGNCGSYRVIKHGPYSQLPGGKDIGL